MGVQENLRDPRREFLLTRFLIWFVIAFSSVGKHSAPTGVRPSFYSPCFLLEFPQCLESLHGGLCSAVHQCLQTTPGFKGETFVVVVLMTTFSLLHSTTWTMKKFTNGPQALGSSSLLLISY